MGMVSCFGEAGFGDPALQQANYADLSAETLAKEEPRRAQQAGTGWRLWWSIPV